MVDELNDNKNDTKIEIDFDLESFKHKNINDQQLLDLIIKKRELDPNLKDMFNQYYG
jgi:hypothetical protein